MRGSSAVSRRHRPGAPRARGARDRPLRRLRPSRPQRGSDGSRSDRRSPRRHETSPAVHHFPRVGMAVAVSLQRRGARCRLPLRASAACGRLRASSETSVRQASQSARCSVTARRLASSRLPLDEAGYEVFSWAVHTLRARSIMAKRALAPGSLPARVASPASREPGDLGRASPPRSRQHSIESSGVRARVGGSRSSIEPGSPPTSARAPAKRRPRRARVLRPHAEELPSHGRDRCRLQGGHRRVRAALRSGHRHGRRPPAALGGRAR